MLIQLFIHSPVPPPDNYGASSHRTLLQAIGIKHLIQTGEKDAVHWHQEGGGCPQSSAQVCGTAWPPLHIVKGDQFPWLWFSSFQWVCLRQRKHLCFLFLLFPSFPPIHRPLAVSLAPESFRSGAWERMLVAGASPSSCQAD